MHTSVIFKDTKCITYKYKAIKCQSLRDDNKNVITFCFVTTKILQFVKFRNKRCEC